MQKKQRGLHWERSRMWKTFAHSSAYYGTILRREKMVKLLNSAECYSNSG